MNFKKDQAGAVCRLAVACLAVWLGLAAPARAQWELDAEAGALVSVPYLETQTPRTTGTFLDLRNELAVRKRPIFRLRLSYTFNDKHTLSVLAAPLVVASEGRLGRVVNYNGVLFPADTPLRTEYQFNAYRLTYRYAFVRTERLRLAAGLTAFVRDGDLRVSSASQFRGKPGVGVLPLLNVYASWQPVRSVQLLVEGDGLGTSNGRAIDAFGGVVVNLTNWLGVKGGYRIIEGKADTDDFYTRAWFNFVTGGVVVTLPRR